MTGPSSERTAAHEHAWKMVLHLDSCHGYESQYRCECGAGLRTYSERDINANPYSMVWMDSEGREPCKRCEELIAGAKPKHEREVVEAIA